MLYKKKGLNFNFFFRITGAMGKGLAALTFDKEYQKKRREQLNKKPANLQEGLARSGKGLVMVSIFFLHNNNHEEKN